MPGLNDLSSDELIRHNISLLRFDAKLRRQVMGQLRTMQESIVLQLSEVGTIATKQRLQGLLSQVDSIVKTGYKGINTHMLGEMRDLAGVEQMFATNTLNNLIKVDIISAGLTPQVLRAMGKNSSILGAPAKEWWGRQSANLRNRFGDEMRQGFLLGEGTGDLVRRVRGTATGARQIIEVGGKAKSVAVFSGGIMNISTREATALVRTSINSVANEVRLATYLDNTDVIQAVQAVVTLDARTSEICIAKGNRPDEWTLPDFIPVGGSTNYIGPPPWHYNCRSSLAPITKSWEELQNQSFAPKATASQKRIARRLDNNAPKATRASMDGKVPKATGYSKWLNTQPKSVQLEVLGPGKRELWKKGELNLSQLIDQQSRPLTLRQIEDRIVGTAERLTNLPSGTTIRRAKNFDLTGQFDITLTDGRKFQIFKKEDRNWYEAIRGDSAGGQFLAKTRAKAIVEIEKKLGATTLPKPIRPATSTDVILRPLKGGPKATKEVLNARFLEGIDLRQLEFNEIFRDTAGNVYKNIGNAKVGNTLKALRWDPVAGKFMSAGQRGAFKRFGFVSKKPPLTAATVDIPVVKAINYRALKPGAIFKDEAGEVFKVIRAGGGGLQVVPQSIKTGKFLSPKNGRTLPYGSRPVKQVEKAIKATKLGKTSLDSIMVVDKFLGKKGVSFTNTQLQALDNAKTFMSNNGFNPKLANVLGKRNSRARLFNMGPEGKSWDWLGRSEVGQFKGTYWDQSRALGVSSGDTIASMTNTFTHEFGHHIDYIIFRNRFKLPAPVNFGKAARLNFNALERSYNAMKLEFRAASKNMANKVGVRRLKGGEFSPKQLFDNVFEIEKNLKGIAPSAYSLFNEMEWFAESFAEYFSAHGRKALKLHQPRTFEFFERLMSPNMDEAWKAIGGGI